MLKVFIGTEYIQLMPTCCCSLHNTLYHVQLTLYPNSLNYLKLTVNTLICSTIRS